MGVSQAVTALVSLPALMKSYSPQQSFALSSGFPHANVAAAAGGRRQAGRPSLRGQILPLVDTWLAHTVMWGRCPPRAFVP